MRTPLKFIIIPYLVKTVIVLLTATCRVRWNNRDAIEQFIASQEPVLISMWHNCSTFSPWAMRNRNMACMVSASQDGEYVARLAALFGNKTIRGSSSKGASSATRAVLKLLRKGEAVGITPDGPRGPKYQVQPGVLFLAAVGKVPILPFHIEASRQWVLKSWDNHRFPKPFSTIHIGIGKPVIIDRTLLNENSDKAAQLVKDVMMENVDHLKQAAGHSA